MPTAAAAWRATASKVSSRSAIRSASPVATIASAAPVQAEWLRARSRHFVIYSDTRPDEIRRLATRLEQVDGVGPAVVTELKIVEAAAQRLRTRLRSDGHGEHVPGPGALPA